MRGPDDARQNAEEAWDAERELRHKETFRRRLMGSVAAHVAVVAVLAVSPAPSALPAPAVVSVSLLAAAPAPAARPAAKPQARPKPAAPAAVPKPAPPKPNKVVLPKDAPSAKPKKPEPEPEREVEPEELDYEDAMAQLRDELGQPEEPTAQEILDAARTPGQGAPSGSGRVDPEMAAWQSATANHVRRTWITPPEFLNRNLETVLMVTLLSDGSVVDAAVERSSGDAYADDNALRALRRASPLPAPPRGGGEMLFVFKPEGR